MQKKKRNCKSSGKKINLDFCDESGRKKKTLSNGKEEWLSSFLDRPDLPRQTLRRKYSVYVSKVDFS